MGGNKKRQWQKGDRERGERRGGEKSSPACILEEKRLCDLGMARHAIHFFHFLALCVQREG